MPQKIELEFPDGFKREFDKGINGFDVAKSIGPRLAIDALAIEINGKVSELSAPIGSNGAIKILTWSDLGGKKALWHTASHVLREAVEKIFPKAVAGIGPPTDNGFYYDFDVEKPFTPDDLEKIEKKMVEIISKKQKISSKVVSKKEALKLFEKNKYKKELIKEFAGEKKDLTIYFTGKFFDLCKGGHVEDVGKIKAVKLLKTAGAYWRGSEKNKALQRIYGIAFPKQKMLSEFLDQMKKSRQFSHLKLGKELDLFSMHSQSPGTIFFHPKGTVIYSELVKFLSDLQLKKGYNEVITPLILKKELWVKSGHWNYYKKNMFFTRADKEEYAVKPMNCPGHVLLYNTKRHSYKDLPLRFSEFGTLHRLELSGVLNGLFRVRKFTQDDAHIFCSKEQLEDEIKKIVSLVDFVYKVFGFEYRVELSTKPKKSMGSPAMWERATLALKNALKEKRTDYKTNEGEGAFYGPKIDFHIKDSMNRSWQLGTIQVDFSMPEKFESHFINSRDEKETPVMLHRAVFGSLERFIGILIEHFKGSLPLWLSPVQVQVFPVSEKSESYAKKVQKTLLNAGIRSFLDLRKETVSYKVRDAQLQKIPFIVTVGEKEMAKQTLAVRNRLGKVEFGILVKDFLHSLKKKILAKKLA